MLVVIISFIFKTFLNEEVANTAFIVQINDIVDMDPQFDSD